ncbi:MAG: hypothetical protein L6R36_005935 [Xanthoria steineri]|nr:MAG: hypothetical protein L6R36_005935 [Xanthoria steineri]
MAEETKRGPYSILRRPTRSFSVDRNRNLFLFVLSLAWISWLLYIASEFALACRITGKSSLPAKHVWIAVGAEFVLTFQELVLALGLLIGLVSSQGQKSRPSYVLGGESAPTIDVLITCCGEAVDVILDTVKAAAAQDYPTSRFRVLVLDDKRDDELRRSIGQLQPWLREGKFGQVEYLAREVKKGARSFFKAGNLNYGINASPQGREPSEYFAGLDCDMIAEPDWLRRCVAHMLLSDDIGMVVSPQRYYDVPPGDPLGQQADFSMYFCVQEVLNDASNACMCTGTGYVARRTAIESIGGWPLPESGEDYMCSALLTDAGWKIAYVRDNLQYGSCPGSMRALLKQRMRWTNAGIEVHRFFRFYLGHSALTARMDLAQKAVNVLYMLRDYAPVALVLALAVLPYELSAHNASSTSSADLASLGPALRVHRALLLLAWFCNKLWYLVFYSHIGLSRVWNFQSNEIWAAPSLNTPSFDVCGAVPASERSVRSRPSLPARCLNINSLMWISCAVYTSAPFLLHGYYSLSGTRSSSGHVPSEVWLLPGPPLKLMGAVLKMMVPVKYMLFPPDMPDRASMLAADEKGVKRVKRMWKESGEKKEESGIWSLIAGVELGCWLMLCGFI